MFYYILAMALSGLKPEKTKNSYISPKKVLVTF